MLSEVRINKSVQRLLRVENGILFIKNQMMVCLLYIFHKADRLLRPWYGEVRPEADVSAQREAPSSLKNIAKLDLLMSNFYRSIDVWKRTHDGKALKYVCFELLGESKYCVQSIDVYDNPQKETNAKYLDNLFTELFIEEAPECRSELFDSLEEAVSAAEAATS